MPWMPPCGPCPAASSFPTQVRVTRQRYRSRSPILLATDVPAADEVPPGAVLVNLKAGFPTGFEAFARVIEVVTQENADREQARERWRQYRALGIEPQRHDLVSAVQS